jgi:short-subunit dehydrogenase
MLTRAVLPRMMARNHGAIINVSSMAAWFQSAGNVHYGATKCFLAVFSQSLQQELRGTNVRVQALCPGFIHTEFHDAESMNGFHLRCAPAAHLWMSPEEVVNCSLRRLSGKQVVVIPGFWYRILGRLAQMPVLQPLMRRLAQVPRGEPGPGQTIDPCLAPSAAQTVDSRLAPASVVAEIGESAIAS